MAGKILTINGGSSSLKFALFESIESRDRLLEGKLERIGSDGGSFSVSEGGSSTKEPVRAPDHAAAIGALLDLLDERIGLDSIACVGHRIVHGGARYVEPELVTSELMEAIRALEPLDPNHLPGEIAMIEAFSRRCPDLPQVLCFDTAFHASMPRVAQLLPIPRRYESAGLRRYGFHGLSYQFLMEELARLDAKAAQQRVILAHLGAGSSLAAVRGGRSIDTTMGFTPTAGMPMGTRSGDLDPGVLLYLLRNEHMSVDQLDELVNHRSGLRGVSDSSSDVRDLLERRSSDARADEAVSLYCYQAKKWIGAFAAALGGLDTLVFAGGIGENSPQIRAEICTGLDFLGVTLDTERNAAGRAVISTDTSSATARVIKTDEEIVIARAVAQVLANREA